jgi:hypothetical protein
MAPPSSSDDDRRDRWMDDDLVPCGGTLWRSLGGVVLCESCDTVPSRSPYRDLDD